MYCPATSLPPMTRTPPPVQTQSPALPSPATSDTPCMTALAPPLGIDTIPPPLWYCTGFMTGFAFPEILIAMNNAAQARIPPAQPRAYLWSSSSLAPIFGAAVAPRLFLEQPQARLNAAPRFICGLSL
jgi:hypothetical protein